MKTDKKQEIREFLIKRGYIEYKKDCFAKSIPPKTIPNGFWHYKIGSSVLKREERVVKKMEDGEDFKYWFCNRRGFYGKITIINDKISWGS